VSQSKVYAMIWGWTTSIALHVQIPGRLYDETMLDILFSVFGEIRLFLLYTHVDRKSGTSVICQVGMTQKYSNSTQTDIVYSRFSNYLCILRVTSHANPVADPHCILCNHGSRL